MTEEQKAYQRNYWKQRKEHPEIRERNKYLTELRKKHKKLNIEYDGQIISIEAMLPFRIMEDYGKLKVIDQKAYSRLQTSLRHKISEIENTSLVVVEPAYIQCFFKEKENVETVIEAIAEFVREQVKTYGKYKKIGRNIGVDFE